MKTEISYALYDPEAGKYLTTGPRGNSTGTLLKAAKFKKQQTAELQRENWRRYTQVLEVTSTTKVASEKARSPWRAA